MRIVVTGAGGFIGHHLVKRLKRQGHFVRGVDVKRPRWGDTLADEFYLLDLRDRDNAWRALAGMEQCYALAADMGGIGFISSYHAEIVCHNTLININTIEAARRANLQRLLFSSSACVYPVYRQDDLGAAPLKESDVYPAMPEGAYGWEKLHMEHLCRYYREAGWLDTRVVRFHNVYGPEGDYEGGREKAPAALCRKVAQAQLTGNLAIDIWGDGRQVRSFMYVDDCTRGLTLLMESDHAEPLNLGTDRGITINALAELIATIADVRVNLRHIPGPQGVRARNSDNTLCRQVLGWEPTIPLEVGLPPTYRWIAEQVRQGGQQGGIVEQPVVLIRPGAFGEK